MCVSTSWPVLLCPPTREDEMKSKCSAWCVWLRFFTRPAVAASCPLLPLFLWSIGQPLSSAGWRQTASQSTRNSSCLRPGQPLWIYGNLGESRWAGISARKHTLEDTVLQWNLSAALQLWVPADEQLCVTIMGWLGEAHVKLPRHETHKIESGSGRGAIEGVREKRIGWGKSQIEREGINFTFAWIPLLLILLGMRQQCCDQSSRFGGVAGIEHTLMQDKAESHSSAFTFHVCSQTHVLFWLGLHDTLLGTLQLNRRTFLLGVLYAFLSSAVSKGNIILFYNSAW